AKAERLGPLAQYAEIGARPVLNDDRRPQPFFINPEGEGGARADVFDFVLTSVLLTPRFQMAIVQPKGGGVPIRLKSGDAPDSAPSWTLGAISARSAVFNGPEGERTLELRVFDGNGGEPPTAMSVTPGTAPRPGQLLPRLSRLSPQPGVPPGQIPASATPQPPAINTSGEAVLSGEQNDLQAQQAQQQVEAIRQRINARRAQLRQEAQNFVPPPAPL
ncbi:MAG: hypothetical protein ACREO8_02460, partial [Luteimonas sp.]